MCGFFDTVREGLYQKNVGDSATSIFKTATRQRSSFEAVEAGEEKLFGNSVEGLLYR
jgi:hypothetical protein